MSKEAVRRGADDAPQPEPFSRLVIGTPPHPTVGSPWPVADSTTSPDPTDAPALLVDGGVVSWFDAEEGWGAIRTDAGHDVFAHFSAIDTPGYRTLSAGQYVHVRYRPGDQDGYRWVAELIRAL